MHTSIVSCTVSQHDKLLRLTYGDDASVVTLAIPSKYQRCFLEESDNMYVECSSVPVDVLEFDSSYTVEWSETSVLLKYGPDKWIKAQVKCLVSLETQLEIANAKIDSLTDTVSQLVDTCAILKTQNEHMQEQITQLRTDFLRSAILQMKVEWLRNRNDNLQYGTFNPTYCLHSKNDRFNGKISSDQLSTMGAMQKYEVYWGEAKSRDLGDIVVSYAHQVDTQIQKIKKSPTPRDMDALILEGCEVKKRICKEYMDVYYNPFWGSRRKE